MKTRFRLFPLLFLCLALFLSGCSALEKQKLPYHPQNEVSIWMNSLAGLSGVEQGRRADALRKSPTASLALRDKALSVAASRPGSQGYRARTDLANTYASGNALQKSAWEALYWTDLDGMEDADLRALASKVSPEQEKRFPWNLVMLKAARKGLAPDSKAALARLSSASLYAAPEALGFMAARPAADGPVHIALVLPQNGPASALGRQVAAGALAASDALQAKGRKVEVRIVDAAQPDWEQQVKALPVEFTAIGGPLLPHQTAAVLQAAEGRAVFSFTNALPADAEGVKAWRFFSSPEDQMKALLDGAEKIGVSTFGVFSNGEKYGARMSDAFEKEALARGFSVEHGTYTAGDMGAWAKETKAFLKTTIGEQRGSLPVATAAFKGIFLADSWKNMEMLVSSLQYNGAHSKLILGTSLWEQSLGPTSRSNPATFGLTMFPASWNSTSSEDGATEFKLAMATRSAKLDDWSALGYDFVQTAAALGLDAGWTPSLVNERLSSIQVKWAAAPMSWDAAGKASRKLFLMRPAAIGSIPADLDAMKERLRSQEEAMQTVLEAQSKKN
ncbi:MAG: hypothetical protein IJD65_00415 [Mailhella sp.]|nr:hypothetical protein [Mailhella sp.]